MDRSLKWRTIILVGAIALSALMLMPTLVPSNRLPAWFANTFNQKMQLGLDLQGGLHIVYSIDLDKAVDDKASDIKREIETKLSEIKLDAKVTTPLRPIGAVTVVVNDPKDLPRIKGDLFGTLLDDGTVIERECTGDDVAKSYCVRVSTDYAEGIKKSALEQAILTVRERIDERGVAEPSVVAKGDQIIVELPGLDKDSIARVKEIIQRTAKLEFKVVDDSDPFMSSVYRRVVEDIQAAHSGASDEEILDGDLTTKEGIGVDIDGWAHDESGKQFQDWYLTASDREESFTIAEARERNCYREDKAVTEGSVQCKVSGREVIERYLTALAAADPKFHIDDDHAWGYEFLKAGSAGGKDPFWRTYYLFRPVELAGSSVANAYVYWNQNNIPEVLVEFDRFGGQRFEEMTGKNVGKKMAIILDDKVSSAPVIQAKIGGGRSSITMGGGTDQDIQKEAEDLVNVLRTGSLPAPLKIDSQSEVGPLLGRDAIDKAKFSFILGGILTFAFVIWVYRFSGVIASVSLVLNVLFLMGCMAALQATLTLPGIAALVLTIGMAIDSNIIVFERIREELRAGKSVKGAVEAGFSNAYSAIIDGQLTTAAAGFVLYVYGSGPIKGFAVMLLIGIFTTLFSAVWCTRTFFLYYVGRQRKAETISI